MKNQEETEHKKKHRPQKGVNYCRTTGTGPRDRREEFPGKPVTLKVSDENKRD